jgi:iron complex outermembrane recepter protein
LKSNTRGVFDWELAASLYDYSKDVTRSALVAYPSAETGGAGRITDLGGTGWNTLSARSVWRPGAAEKSGGAHIVEFGAQQYANQLRTLISDTTNWKSGDAEARFSAFTGNTKLQALYAQDTWTISPKLRSTLGVRFEHWKASSGSVANASSAKALSERSENYVSPKFALAYQSGSEWVVKGSLGRAIRTPTVAELYQGSISANTVVNNDPNLRPEKSWTAELTTERELSHTSIRVTAFFERTKDALFSQTNVTVTPNVTNIQNVDEVLTRGIEFVVNAADVAVKGLDLSGSVTWARSIIEKNDKFPASVGKRQPRVPDWRANVLATYRIGDQWSFTAGARYSGMQYGTLNNIDPNGRTYTGVSKFLVADIRARYRLSANFTASIGIDNLNNAKYWAFHPYTQRMYVAELKGRFY